eukprot:2016148-Alexandrium_andersonii.AAC.1
MPAQPTRACLRRACLRSWRRAQRPVDEETSFPLPLVEKRAGPPGDGRSERVCARALCRWSVAGRSPG